MKHYDYIFTGSGLAALMTVYRMAISGKFSQKSILLIDAQQKNSNDRTWSYWEKHPGEFDKIVSKKWDSALFAGGDFRKTLDLSPYRYKTIHGKDFYDLVLNRIQSEENIEILNENVIDFYQAGDFAIVKTATKSFTCGKILNSIYNAGIPDSQEKYPVLQQHFIGWFVKTKELVFNPNQLTFMDFSVEQKGNTRFMYVLPFSETEALVEYTLFSEELLRENDYESEIEKYLEKLGASEYQVSNKERGSIPMTCFRFWKRNSKHVLHIGSAGGWTKPSTGFTFRNAMKKSEALVNFLHTGSDLRQFEHTRRFWYYDLLLLDILSENNGCGREIFSAIFRNASADTVLRFLDEETSLTEDLEVIWKCPKKLFLSAAVKRLFR